MRSSSWSWAAVFCLLFSLFTPVFMVKEHDFKKCDQSGFCKRNRAYADAATSSTWSSPYNVFSESVALKDGKLEAIILKTIAEDGATVRLPLTVSFLKSGTARVTVDEEKRLNKDIELRHGSNARKERYNEAEKFAIVGGLDVDAEAKVAFQDKDQITVKFGPEGKFEAHIKFAPFGIDFKRDGSSQIKFNDRGLLNMEHWRPKIDKAEYEKDSEGENKDENKEEKPQGEDESTWWEETFGGNTDSKPRGPESIGLDISFVDYEHVFGIPSHAGPLSLKETRGGDGNYNEPYRFYNLDVFEYILDSPMSLYGAIPFMQAHRKDSTVGVFWLNAAETWIDITKAKSSKNPMALGLGSKKTTQTHWISESGLLDVFVFLGPSPKDVIQKYGELTGFTAMPQEFSLGYHQCRWNYISDDDVKDVDRKMDKFHIPYDVIWLDIEYTDGKKYFTWDKDMFKDPIGMTKKLDEHGRKLVVIIDPHIKNEPGYQVVEELKSKDLAVKTKDGSIFEGWCWPGASHYIDAFNSKAVEWWKTLFQYSSFTGTAENVFIWNDMNEPSVFNGPEVSMPKDNLHHGNWEHRDVHNLNGMTFHNATHQALISRKPGEKRRPFVLTRSFFAGSQRLGAMWTGDNQASWEHLGAATPMLLSQGIAGFPFSGADVGGFFGNPESELMARWYQAGAFYPFFRGHAHIDARRREPYLVGEPYTSIMTKALRLRYSLLPSWYTTFQQAATQGTPIIRPMFYTHPSDEGGFAIDDQFFVGETGLLHKPVTEKDKNTVDIYIPDDEVYYNYFTYGAIATTKGKHTTMPAPLDTIPLLMRGGHILARRDIPRRSSALMRFDPYTLVVTYPKSGRKAEGSLYVDDGDSFDYVTQQYVHRKFVLEDNTISSADFEGRDQAALRKIKPGSWMKAFETVVVDKIVVLGVPVSKSAGDSISVTVEGTGADGKPVKKTVEAELVKTTTTYAVIRGVGARVSADWKVSLAL
ncbi:uncharacterized protein PgNI_02799 [Pyricularia grisea]|uniref:alpha-glucosidase n=1 Tax=Pyricularia grisea TaxID=148305 RepID=A0A6P8BD84_PYRGI|nr:uncharacterized protein PgNI_02799 [Pyricularia grisea]TLD13836.1 hypothetical protein PgNI_02799 [Pyricularia grisea]